jgi:hypothetical protein
MPENCEPDALAAAAACYCFTPKQSDAVTIYLLNRISGLNLSPDDLARNAKRFCFDRKTAAAVKNYLLCQIANGGSPGGCQFIWGPDPTVLGPVQIINDDTSTSYEFPTLETLNGSFNVAFSSTLQSISLPSLVTVTGTINLDSDIVLTTLDISNLVTIGADFNGSNSTLLATILCGSWVPTNGRNIYFTDCALSKTTMELILRRLVLAGVTTCDIGLTGGTNAGLASLSAQGQADAATLTGLGNAFAMNP